MIQMSRKAWNNVVIFFHAADDFLSQWVTLQTESNR